jgi:glutamine amidotransferase
VCRWLAYTGSPILLTDVLYTPVHSLIDQSLHSKMGAETTNGDGFGIGWYDARPAPGVFRSIEPAWNNQNLHELAGHVSSHLFFAHVRPRSGRRCSSRTATHSAMAAGCGCTMGSPMASPPSNGT